jgi:hypothetical protein
MVYLAKMLASDALPTGRTRTNVDFQIEIVPADGIRAAIFQEAATSERRRFGAALDQVNMLDRAST